MPLPLSQNSYISLLTTQRSSHLLRVSLPHQKFVSVNNNMCGVELLAETQSNPPSQHHCAHWLSAKRHRRRRSGALARRRRAWHGHAPWERARHCRPRRRARWERQRDLALSCWAEASACPATAGEVYPPSRQTYPSTNSSRGNYLML